MGGSYPISIFSEFFWNFHLVGIFMTIFLIIFCYYVYANLINAVKIFHVPKILFFMVCYLNIIMLARGSGLDLYILFVLLSGFFIMCYSFLEAALFKINLELLKVNLYEKLSMFSKSKFLNSL